MDAMAYQDEEEKAETPLMLNEDIEEINEVTHGQNYRYTACQRTWRQMSRTIQSTTTNIWFSLLPSPVYNYFWPSNISDKGMSHGNTAYLDGLRGLAAIVVFIEHFSHPYQPTMLTPYGEKGNWSWTQLPFISLLYSGSPMVMIFFVISGFSLSLRPLKCIRNREQAELLDALASATFRRAVRLLLPCIVSTFCVVIAIRLHLYDTEYKCASPYMELDPPPHFMPSLGLQLLDWVRWVLTHLIYPWRWFTDHPYAVPSEYSMQLWTISTELFSSYVLFVVILGTSRVRSTMRIGIATLLISLMMWSRSWDIALFVAGMILAELHLLQTAEGFPVNKKGPSLLVRFISYLVLIVGLYLVSLPDFYSSASPIYGWMTRIWTRPQEWQSLGAIQVIWALGNIPELQKVLSCSFAQYIGKVSFSLYIVHVPILQLFGWNLVPLWWVVTGNDSGWQYQLGFFFALFTLFPITLWVADIFWRGVDLKSTKLSKFLDNLYSAQ